MATTSSKKIIDKQLILAKAFFNTGEQLNLSLTQLAAILNISEAKIKELKIQLKIDPASKQGELAILFIRLFRKLHQLCGGDLDWIQFFLKSNNRVTGGIPVKQIETAQGLVFVLQFVEAIQ